MPTTNDDKSGDSDGWQGDDHLPSHDPHAGRAPDPAEKGEVVVPLGTINGRSWGAYLEHKYAGPAVIPLYDMTTLLCGLLVEAPSGFRWRQQTSGFLCTQRELEGLFVPIPDRELAANLGRLHPGCSVDSLDDRERSAAYRATHCEEVEQAEAWARERMPEIVPISEAWSKAPPGITVEEANGIDQLLREALLPLQVDRTRLERSAEAWVWVRVADDVAHWQHEYMALAVPDNPRRPHRHVRNPNGYRFAWSFAALAGKSAILTWENCD